MDAEAVNVRRPEQRGRDDIGLERAEERGQQVLARGETGHVLGQDVVVHAEAGAVPVLEGDPRAQVGVGDDRLDLLAVDERLLLGERETGGGLSLPVWISYMQHALQGVAVQEMPVPTGVVNEGGDWYYREFPRTTGVTNLGLDGKGNGELPAADEKRKILDLFKN